MKALRISEVGARLVPLIVKVLKFGVEKYL